MTIEQQAQLMQLQNDGRKIMYYAAALASARTFEEAYEALHYICNRVMFCEDITNNVDQELLGYVADVKHMPDALDVELRGTASKLIAH
jgi:hypothetical protein